MSIDPRSVTTRAMLSGCADNLALTDSIVRVWIDLATEWVMEGRQEGPTNRCHTSDAAVPGKRCHPGTLV